MTEENLAFCNQVKVDQVRKVVDKNPIEKVPKKTISMANPDYKLLMSEILDLYGYPISTDNCLNKSDRIMFGYGMIATFTALNRDYSLAEEAVKMKEIGAEFFSRSYFEKYRCHPIPEETQPGLIESFKALKEGSEDEKQKQDSRLDPSRSDEEG